MYYAFERSLRDISKDIEKFLSILKGCELRGSGHHVNPRQSGEALKIGCVAENSELSLEDCRMILDAIFWAPVASDPDFLGDMLDNGVRLLILLHD